MVSKQRALLVNEIFPALPIKGKVLFVGVDSASRYERKFPEVTQYDTIDIKPGQRATITGDICHCPGIESETYDWVIFNGVFEQAIDPWAAMREMLRILKVGGYILVGAPWGSPNTGWADKWRMSFKGLLAYLKDFDILGTWNVDDQYLYGWGRKRNAE